MLELCSYEPSAEIPSQEKELGSGRASIARRRATISASAAESQVHIGSESLGVRVPSKVELMTHFQPEFGRFHRESPTPRVEWHSFDIPENVSRIAGTGSQTAVR
jgi:hypothetical protein